MMETVVKGHDRRVFYRVEHVGHRCIIIIINFVRKDPCKTFFNSSLDELSNYIFCTSFIRVGMQGIQIKYFPRRIYEYH